MTAAGPWIRVDSVERPEEHEMILACIDGEYLTGYYCDGAVCPEGPSMPLRYCDYWARILPPGTETESTANEHIARELDRIVADTLNTFVTGKPIETKVRRGAGMVLQRIKDRAAELRGKP